MVKLTRRQWLELPVEMKHANDTTRYVLIEPGKLLPVTWVTRVEDSDLSSTPTAVSEISPAPTDAAVGAFPAVTLTPEDHRPY